MNAAGWTWPEGDAIPTDLQNWIETALAELLAAQNSDGGWGYARGRQSNTEATAICSLALSALLPADPALPSALAFLEARRRADGALAGSAVVAEPTWTTPLAGMALGRQGHAEAAQLAANWLLTTDVFVLDPIPTALYGYDTTIPGWPWTAGDYSFVEPTAAAVVFLKQQGHAQHARVREAIAMLVNRALPAGGWNYGEPIVLNSQLFPAAVPTAMALLASADEPSDVTAAALEWLAQQRGMLTSLFSLGWACIALNVMAARDEAWTAELMSRWYEASPDRRYPMETALCLLGGASREGHPLSLEGTAG